MDPKDALAGRYELLEPIGATERAASFHARDHKKRQMVVIKRFDPARLPVEALTRYAATVALLKQSNPKGAVLPLDVVTSGPTPFAVYNPLVGESAAQIIARPGQCSWPQAADIIARCAGVLSTTLTATGQSHRALKPSNLWVSPTGEVSVLDLGIAELGVYPVPPRDGPLFVEYRAPEQLDGAPGDARSDVFVLGVLLYELATGIHPFSGSSAFHVARQLVLAASPSMSALTRGMSQGGAREAEKLLGRALARAPAGRFASAQEFLQALEFARRVIGAPSRLAQAAEAPASTPKPDRPIVVVEDPTTIIQPPGLSTPRREAPAQPLPTPSTKTPPRGQALVPRPPPSPSPEAVVPNPPRAAPRPTRPRKLAPVEQITERQMSPARTPMTVPPAQPHERTEVLPAASRQPVAELVTERDMVAATPGAIGPEDELQTVAWCSTPATAEAMRGSRSRVETSAEPPTAVYSLPILDSATAPSTLKAPVAEKTLLLPPDDARNDAQPAVFNDSDRSERQPMSAPPASRTHRVLIALNLLCIVLVLCGLLLSALS